ncbi:MAG: preprotein translocase subunit YajC [Longimicrobiales bacterium]|nr:preprotein translocase subunit YajC [Longimicrobiales bacterium]
MTPYSMLLVMPREGGNSGMIFLGQMLLIFGIFYFLLIRPQTKERQKHEAMLAAIKKGDEIVTNGGIIGKVVHAEEKRLTIKTGDNTRITVDRGRVAAVLDAMGDPKDE